MTFLALEQGPNRSDVVLGVIDQLSPEATRPNVFRVACMLAAKDERFGAQFGEGVIDSLAYLTTNGLVSISKGSQPQGTWELTEAGRKRLDIISQLDLAAT